MADNPEAPGNDGPSDNTGNSEPVASAPPQMPPGYPLTPPPFDPRRLAGGTGSADPSRGFAASDAANSGGAPIGSARKAAPDHSARRARWIALTGATAAGVVLAGVMLLRGGSDDSVQLQDSATNGQPDVLVPGGGIYPGDEFDSPDGSNGAAPYSQDGDSAPPPSANQFGGPSAVPGSPGGLPNSSSRAS